jgi:hypothetical protein
MDIILRIVNLLCSGIALILTIIMLISYRKEREFQPLSLLFSITLSLVMLPIFILISGARLNIWIASVLFLLGALFGIIRGFVVKLYYQNGKLVGKNSLLSLFGWGGSLALAMLMNSFDSALLASLGLAPLCLTTGTQVCLNGTLLLRRLFTRPPLAEAA